MPIVTEQVFSSVFGLMGIVSNVLASPVAQPVLLVEAAVASTPAPPQSPPPSPASLPTPSSVSKPRAAPPAQGNGVQPPPPVPDPVETPAPPPPPITGPRAAPPVQGEREIPYPPPTLIQKPKVTPSVEGKREIPTPPPPDPEPKPPDFVQQRLADLSIVGIHGSSCSNGQAEAGSFYMGTIDVYVGKRDIRATGVHEQGVMVGTLIVKYKDGKSGNSVNQQFVLYNFHFSGGDARVRVSASPVWISKSTGVFAEIQLKSPDYALTDPKTANNTMRIHHCEAYPR